MEIKYSYKSAPTLRDFSNSDAFFRCVVGPFGSGKSVASVVEIISRALAQKPGPDGIRRSRWMVVRNTYRQLQDSTIKTFMDWVPPVYFGEYRQSDHTYMIKGFEGVEAEVSFRALDRPDHLSNLLSVELTGCWLNEMRDLAWPIVEVLQGRVGRYPSKRDGGASWWGIFGDTNPADVDSKLYKYFVETKHDPKYAQLFMQPSGLSKHAENLENLPGGANYYKNMAVGKDEEWVKVYCKGEWGFVIDGRQVYPEYNDSVHCKEIKPLSYEPIVRGFDFGLTPSCVFTQLDPTGQLLILSELTSESMGVDQFAEEVISYCSMNYPDYTFIDVGDPAGGQRAQTDARTCFQILHGKGIMVEPGMQSMAIRLESVRRPLTRLIMGKPGLQMSPKCKMLRKGFMGGYQFRRLQMSQERYTTAPDKNQYSHPHDALQYACTYYFGGGLTTPQFREDRDFRDEEISDQGRSSTTGY